MKYKSTIAHLSLLGLLSGNLIHTGVASETEKANDHVTDRDSTAVSLPTKALAVPLTLTFQNPSQDQFKKLCTTLFSSAQVWKPASLHPKPQNFSSDMPLYSPSADVRVSFFTSSTTAPRTLGVGKVLCAGYKRVKDMHTFHDPRSSVAYLYRSDSMHTFALPFFSPTKPIPVSVTVSADTWYYVVRASLPAQLVHYTSADYFTISEHLYIVVSKFEELKSRY